MGKSQSYYYYYYLFKSEKKVMFKYEPSFAPKIGRSYQEVTKF